MANANPFSKWAALPLLTAALACAGTGSPAPAKTSPEAKPAASSESKPSNSQVTPEAKSPLSDAFIAQGSLHVFLERPASVTVYNARGQQIFHRDTHAAFETVPLQGATTGFVYLTVRAEKAEATRKLVYTGK
jgi:hypothetical protein